MRKKGIKARRFNLSFRSRKFRFVRLLKKKFSSLEFNLEKRKDDRAEWKRKSTAAH